MTAYRVDLDRLDELVARLAAVERRAESLGHEIDAEVRRLHGQWGGAAADEHLLAHRQWRDGADAMRAALRELRASLAVAHQNYAAAAAADARMWG